MSRMEAATTGNDHCVLQQFAFPGRRDYQLRSSYMSNHGGALSVITSGSSSNVAVAVTAADRAAPAAPNSPDHHRLLNSFQTSQRHEDPAGQVQYHQESQQQLPILQQLSMNHPNSSAAAENLSSFFLSTGSSSLRNVDCFLLSRSMDKLRSGYTSSFHNWQQWSGEISLPGTPAELPYSSSSAVDARRSSSCVEELATICDENELTLKNPEKEYGDDKPEAEAELVAEEEAQCKLPGDNLLSSRNYCVSAELELVSASSNELQVLERSSTIKGPRWVSGEDVVETRVAASYPAACAYAAAGRAQLETQAGASAARAGTGTTLERASSCNNIRGGSVPRASYGYNVKRRPSASIAWDSLNESPEDSPMRKPIAAVPFKWEEAPGRARRTITARGSESRALARKLSRKKCYPISYVEHAVQKRSASCKRGEQQENLGATRTGGAQERRGDPDNASAHEAPISAACTTRDGSFRSSRRYYARMSSGVSDTASTTSSCSAASAARFSNLVDQQLEIHQQAAVLIDLVAPAAARFLVDSTNTMSPLPTPSKHALAVPFKWEEAPGKPKVDQNSAAVAAAGAAPSEPCKTTTVAQPPVLQLPPRLIAATVHKFDANTKKAADQLQSHSRYPPSNDLPAAPAPVQRRFSPSDQCSQSSSTAHLRQSGSMERWIDVLKSCPLESVLTPQSSNLQSPLRRSSLGTMSGPTSRRLQSLESSEDASENSWYHGYHYHHDHDHQQQQQQQHHHEHHHHHHQVVQDGMNLASSPTSIFCGPTSCENHQRPDSSSLILMSSVSDAEVNHQHSATDATVLSVSYSNSQVSLSTTSQESSEHSSSDLSASPSSSLRTLLRKCRAKSEWPKDAAATAAFAKSRQHLDLHPESHHEARPATITSSLAKFNTHLNCVSELDVARCGHRSDLFTCNLGYEHQLQSSKLPYTVLAAAEQEQMVQSDQICKADHDDQANNFVRCLRIPCSPARFLSRTQEVAAAGNGVNQTLWLDNPSWVSPASYAEDGYRSPAYTATLELLSPSADLMARRRGSGFRTRSLKFLRPMQLNKSLLVESMCKSLKHTVLRCAMVCSHRTGPLLRHDEHYISTNDFQFCKPI